MDDLTRRALLGDREAQDTLTKQGKLLPCQCGGKVVIDGAPYPTSGLLVRCLECDNRSTTMKTNVFNHGKVKKSLVARWNTRPPLVVFCKDCAYYDHGICKIHSARPDEYSDGYDFTPDNYDFCNYGKRKD